MQNQFLPCKIVDRQWAEKLLDGEVFMRPLFEFGVWEKTNEINDPNRKDIMEGAVASFPNPDTVPFLKNLDPAFKSAIKNVTLIDMGDLQFFKVFCLYCLEFKENKPILPDARVKDFGDTVVVFRDFNSFLLRFFQTILSRYEEHVVLLDRINYYGINENRNLNPLFEKTKRYAYQNELRLAFCLSEKNIWPASMAKSKVYMLTLTGMPSFLFRISGGISIPPVLAPRRMIIARLAPMHSPPKRAHSSLSSVSTKPPAARSSIPSIAGYAIVLTRVESAKVLPRTSMPAANITTLKTAMNADTGMPAK